MNFYFQIYIAAFAYVYGDPLKLINGYDSFGNTCGISNNEKMGGFQLSGIDTSDKRWVITFVGPLLCLNLFMRSKRS